jgi:hypothetical protein
VDEMPPLPFGSGPPANRRLAFSLLLLIFALAAPASAQVFQIDGGSSTLFNGSGGSLAIRSSGYGAHIDFGLFQSKPLYGFEFSAPRWGYDWQVGDQNIPFVLPTDLFDRSYYFVGRGLGAERKTSKTDFLYFAGATSDAFYVPFLNAATPETPAGVFFLKRKLSPKWNFYSRNVLSHTQTSIQSLEWLPRSHMSVGFAGGEGSNQGYAAGSFRWSDDWATLRASYALAGDQFRRITVTEPVLTEQDKENIQLDVNPTPAFRFTVARQNYLSPVLNLATQMSNTVERATVDSFGGWGSLKAFQLYGSEFFATNSALSSKAYAFGARRSLTSRFDFGADYLSSSEQGFAPQRSIIYSIREHLTPRIDLSQFITRNNGQTTISYGGSFLANLFSVNADYQTMYFPLAGAGQPLFRQILTLSINLQFSNGVQLNLDTNVTPDGQVQYTTYGTDYLYGPYMGSSGGIRSSGFYRNMVRGCVVDVSGAPVEGAALLIGNQLAFTDSNGEFTARFRSARDMKFEVAFDQFAAPGSYEVVSAPSTVHAVGEANAARYKIVIRRVATPPPAKPQPPKK